jgi:beta-mannosidase
MTDALTLRSLRPLVRYVDDEQAVLDAWVTLPLETARRLSELERDALVTIQITGSDGFFDEAAVTLPAGERQTMHRFQIVEPQRWWPAGLGEQPLYSLTVRLEAGDDLAPDEHAVAFGLTSVRPADGKAGGDQPAFLVNGQPVALHSVVTVDRIDENQLLPATGDSLLMVTDHYAPELLYQAADQAGILLLQCVPIDAQATPEQTVQAQIDRLTPHPSLAGYFVGHLGRLREQLAKRLKELDPTRTVFRDLPGKPAA